MMTTYSEVDEGFVFTPCDWCKNNPAVVVYKGWSVICKQCARIREIEDDE
jgi:hypothetical protein